MALGSYRVPYCTVADKTSGQRGDGDNGCQPDFARVVKEFVNESKEKGITVSLGTYGYQSMAQIDAMSRNGRPEYKGLHQYFRYGLAW